MEVSYAVLNEQADEIESADGEFAFRLREDGAIVQICRGKVIETRAVAAVVIGRYSPEIVVECLELREIAVK